MNVSLLLLLSKQYKILIICQFGCPARNRWIVVECCLRSTPHVYEPLLSMLERAKEKKLSRFLKLAVPWQTARTQTELQEGRGTVFVCQSRSHVLFKLTVKTDPHGSCKTLYLVTKTEATADEGRGGKGRIESNQSIRV